MKITNELTTFSGLIVRDGRTDPYRFELVQGAGADALFLFRSDGHGGWQAMSSSHGRAERDFLFARYARTADPIDAGDELDDDEFQDRARAPAVSLARGILPPRRRRTENVD